MAAPIKVVKGHDGTMMYMDAYSMQHRIDGPACVYPDGREYWFFHGSRHRLNGPASVNHRGAISFWVNDRQVTESDFPAAVEAYCESHPHCPSVAYYMFVTGRRDQRDT